MARRRYLLLLEEGSAWLATESRGGIDWLEVPLPGESSSGEVTLLLKEALASKGYRGEPLLLGVPSPWCLAATVKASATRREKVLSYRLEEFLPLASEEIACDFILDGSKAFGIAIELRRLQGLVRELEAAGVLVPWISPTLLLALEVVRPREDSGLQAVLWKEGSSIDFVARQDNTPTRWHLHPARVEGLLRALARESRLLSEGVSVLAIGLEDHYPELSSLGWPWSGMESLEIGRREAAAKTGFRILRGKLPKALNLRKGTLGPQNRYRDVRTPLRAAVAALLVFFLALSGGQILRARSYAGLSRNAAMRMDDIFRETFPGQPVPTSVRLRLESSARELRGMRGLEHESEASQDQLSALLVLHEVLRRLPFDVRFSLHQIRADTKGVFLSGVAPTHSDADRIATALSEASFFSVAPPRTEAMAERGVSFILNASLSQTTPPR